LLEVLALLVPDPRPELELVAVEATPELVAEETVLAPVLECPVVPRVLDATEVPLEVADFPEVPELPTVDLGQPETRTTKAASAVETRMRGPLRAAARSRHETTPYPTPSNR
jgi:hypothetical protein